VAQHSCKATARHARAYDNRVGVNLLAGAVTILLECMLLQRSPFESDPTVDHRHFMYGRITDEARAALLAGSGQPSAELMNIANEFRKRTIFVPARLKVQQQRRVAAEKLPDGFC